MTEPARPFGRRINRVLFAVMLAGVAAFVAALLLDSELLFVALAVAFVSAALVFVLPAITLAVPAFRSQPAAARAALRVPALISGVGVALLGALLARASTAAAAFAVGLVLVATGAWAAAQALALPGGVAASTTRSALGHTAAVGLAALAGLFVAGVVPKLAGTKTRAYVAAMRADLRNLVTAEEAYFADSLKYTTDLGPWYAPTSGVVGPTITLTADGWTAQAGHTASVYHCAVFVGSTPLAPATAATEPACDDEPPRYASPLALALALLVAVAAGVVVSRVRPPAAAGPVDLLG
jgi:hypothetical protein